MTELKIQIETGFETEQDLKKSLQQLEGNKKIEVNGMFAYMPRHLRILLLIRIQNIELNGILTPNAWKFPKDKIDSHLYIFHLNNLQESTALIRSRFNCVVAV